MEMAFLCALAAFFATAKYAIDMGARKQDQIDKLTRQKQVLLYRLRAHVIMKKDHFSEQVKKGEYELSEDVIKAIDAEDLK